MKENNFPNYSEIAKHIEQVNKALQPYQSALAEIAVVYNNTVNCISSALNAIYPVLEKISQYKEQIINSVTIAQSAVRTFEAVNKLGESEFVFWEYLSEDVIDDILKSDNIDNFLLYYSTKNGNENINYVIDELKKSRFVIKYLKSFEDSVTAYNGGLYNAALTSLVSIFDGVLADVSGMSRTNIDSRVKAAIFSLENNKELSDVDFPILVLISSFDGAMELFGAYSDFEKEEPNYLNRHWIAHGRSTKQRTQLDCIKVFRLIYGLILIYELSN